MSDLLLAQIDRKLDIVISEQGFMGAKIRVLEKHAEGQNGRLRTLEEWRWRLIGGVGVLLALGSMLRPLIERMFEP